MPAPIRHHAAVTPIAGTLLYATTIGIIVAVAPPESRLRIFVIDWMALPMQLVATLATLEIVRRERNTPAATHSTWRCFCAASLLGMIALVAWNLAEPAEATTRLEVGDLLYLLDYGLLSAGYLAIYVRFGGGFRAPRLWLDALSIMAAVLATLWAIVFGPLAPQHPAYAITWVFALGYGIGAAMMLTTMAVAWMCIPPKVSRLWTTLLLMAGVVQTVWVVGWLASWLTTQDFLGEFVEFGDVLCFTFISLAALLAPLDEERVSVAIDASRHALEFLPTLLILVAIALISGLLAGRPSAGTWVVMGLILICGCLLLIRQRLAHRDFQRLRQELVQRESDERLTEIVRESPDLFLIVTGSGIVTYASPAVASLLRTSARDALGMDVATLFGSERAPAIRQLLIQVATQLAESAAIDLAMASSDGSPRTLHIVAAQHLSNPRIRGITFLVSDITKERSLEREIIGVASTERSRLAADVHDGIGQELTGIAMLLRAAATPGRASPEEKLKELPTILNHLNHAIRSTSDLARGLSPLYVVHGSLSGALESLALNEPMVRVVIDSDFADHRLDKVAAEHLFHITAEAVRNARRHSACSRIDVTLEVEDTRVLIRIVDDGVGYADNGVSAGGLGLRLMDYRARMIGADVQVKSQPKQGTRVEVVLPMCRSTRG